MTTRMPQVIGHVVVAPDQVRLHLVVPHDLEHFPGHFPGLPLLPGVVQVDWAMRLAALYLPLSGAFSALEHLKFHAVILPGMEIDLTLGWDAARRRLQFEYHHDTRALAAGRIVLDQPDQVSDASTSSAVR